MPVALAGSAAVVLPGEGEVRVLLFGGKGAGGTGLARLFQYRPAGFVAGDVNGNGVVDAMDFVLVAFWLSGAPGGLGLGMPLAADLDGSGAVNALDLLLLLLLIP